MVHKTRAGQFSIAKDALGVVIHTEGPLTKEECSKLAALIYQAQKEDDDTTLNIPGDTLDSLIEESSQYD